MSFNVVITQAGLNRAVTATGISAEITEIAVGSQGYTPLRSRTKLGAEVDRVSILSSQNKGGGQWHIVADFNSSKEYAVREVGFYLSDGTLFAVWSHPTNVLFYKTPTARVSQIFDLIFSDFAVENVTIIAQSDLSFYVDPELYALATANVRNAAVLIEQSLSIMKINEKLSKIEV